MSIHERSLMMAAKAKELQSFFDNQAWIYADKIDEDRVLKARFLLTWKQSVLQKKS